MTAPRITSARTGAASAQGGGVAVTGVVHGNVFAGAPVRSRYEEQVRRIAPRQLLDREEELAELASFCTAAEVPSRYVWWQAGAWAGKSALMSWFVINPLPGVRIVSFFVTARLASQADRVAFADNVLEQLAALTGEPIPAYLTAATREAHLLGLLRDAAHLCQDRGERLVLLVDGLDEDTGPDSYSVAALLPAEPAADMRVIVAGRPNPPIPGDVPDHHPLRDPAILRPLPASAAATTVRADMERDLDRMLTGAEIDQDLLGLVVAAGGGLSGTDLAELTGCSPRHVERKLSTVAGRSFASRRSHWPSGDAQVAYVMGHEELQRAAAAELGERRLAAYRERLHEWADGYRQRGWPDSASEYLLRGYHRLLAGTHDLDRMVALVTDAFRQDRLLDRSGSDAQALDNILETVRAIVASAEPDVATLARVIMHRDRLYDRNLRIPAHLPALWAALGQFERAEKLALLATEMYSGTDALAALMRVLVADGHVDRAERIVRSLVEQPEARAAAAADLVRIMARADGLESSRRFAGSVAGTTERISTLAALAEIEAAAGNSDEARLLVAEVRALAAVTSPAPDDRDWAAANVVRALAAVAEYDEAERVVRSTAHWESGPRAASALVACLARVGEQERADALLPLVNETTALGTTIAALVRIAAEAGDIQRAETLCRDNEDAYLRSEARLRLVQAHLRAHDFRRAREVGPTIPDTHLRAEACGALVRALAESGDAEQAREVVDAVPDCRPAGLTGLAWAMVTAGRLDQAADLAQEAQQATHLVRDVHTRDRSACDLIEATTAANGHIPAAEEVIAACIEPERQDRAVSARVRGLVTFGDLGGAEHHAETMVDLEERTRLLLSIAEAAAVDDRDRARRLADAIEQLLPLLPELYWQCESGGLLANVHALLGDVIQAESMVAWVERRLESIEYPNQRSSVLGSLAKVLFQTGDVRRAEEFMRVMDDRSATERAAQVIVETAVKLGRDVERATAIARSVAGPDQYDWLTWAHVRGLAATGDVDEAERLAMAIESPDARAHALTAVATRSETDRAGRLADQVVGQALTSAYAHGRPWLLLELAEAVAPTAATRLIAEAYPLLRWHGPLRTIAQVCPAVLPAISDEFVTLQRR